MSVAGIVVIVILGVAALLALPKKAFAFSPPIVGPAKYPYSDLFLKWGNKYRVDPGLVAAHGKAETNFHPEKVNEEDPAIDYDSSYGLMQVQLATAQDFGAVRDYKNATAAEVAWLMDVSNNIMIGAWNVDRWHDKYPDDWEAAVQMYNIGERGYNVLGRRNKVYLERVRKAYNEYNAS